MHSKHIKTSAFLALLPLCMPAFAAPPAAPAPAAPIAMETPEQMTARIEKAMAHADGSDIYISVYGMLNRSDLAAVERLGQSYLNPKETTADGDAKLTHFHRAIVEWLVPKERDSPKWQESSLFLDKWILAYPKSSFARLGKAAWLIRRGWSFRGGGPGKGVSKEDDRLFAQQIILANRELADHAEMAKLDPYWFELMGTLTFAMNATPDQEVPLMQAAAKLYPTYYSAYAKGVTFNLPQWGGTIDSLDGFIRTIAQTVPADQHDAVYARLYWTAFDDYYKDYTRSTKMDWSTMRRGMEKITRDYPTQWNIQNFARFACLAVDKKTAQEQFARVTAGFSSKAWDVRKLEACSAWANRP